MVPKNLVDPWLLAHEEEGEADGEEQEGDHCARTVACLKEREVLGCVIVLEIG